MRLKCSLFMSAVLLLCATGCQSEPDRTQGTASEATPAAAREAPKSGAPVSNSGAQAPAGMTRTVVAYPTGNRDSSVVEIVRVAPSQVNLGQNFTSELTVTNLTKLPLGSVTIRDLCAKHFKLASSTPTAKVTEGVLLWDLGALQPGEVRNIKVTGSATELAPVENCVSVLYDQSTCMTINVVQPKLALTATATSEILTCDLIAVNYVVSNPGTGSAMNVVVSSPLPEGVVTEAGLNSLSFKAGDLPAGASKSFDVKLKTTKGGRLETKPVATANDGLTASAVTTTVAHTPVLTLSKTGPEQQYSGRNVTYEMVLTNKGDGDARDTVLEDTLPANTQFISASQGGAVAGNKVVWKLGTLKPDAAVRASVVVQPTSFGVIENAANASAYCAKPVAATVKTTIQGIPAILLEVVDQQDPIAVGDNETYVITVTNQGSAADTNIAIVCELEDGMQFVSAGGASTASNDGKTITFRPLATLAPKAKASWQVVVKATAPGDVRFKTSMTSGELTRPVTETEATRFYK